MPSKGSPCDLHSSLVLCQQMLMFEPAQDSSRSHALFTLHIDVESPPDVPGGQPVRRYGQHGILRDSSFVCVELKCMELTASRRLMLCESRGDQCCDREAKSLSLTWLDLNAWVSTRPYTEGDPGDQQVAIYARASHLDALKWEGHHW
eukprot:5672761-Amphidinium_carterae.3